jgi:hypothetical protein
MNDRSGGIEGPNTMSRFVDYINQNKQVRAVLRDVTTAARLAELIENHAEAAGVEKVAAREFAASLALFDEAPNGKETIVELCAAIIRTSGDVAAELVKAQDVSYSLDSTEEGLQVGVPVGRWCRLDSPPIDAPSALG